METLAGVMNVKPVVQLLLVVILSPFLMGLINRIKAFFAGRRGVPLLQLYYDILKLLNKGAVYSRTTSWIFKAGPVVGLSALLAALTLLPFAGYRSIFAFDGDVILLIYLLGLMRFFYVLAALDTGSSFEGMGASREIQFAVLAEPALFLSLAALARQTGRFSLSEIFSSVSLDSWRIGGPILSLIAGALLIIFLAENSRIPVDDPNTHLELTMIHEVMVLDHGGFDFAYVLYSAALKFWILGVLLVGTVLPVHTGLWVFDSAVFIGGMVILAVIVGIIESVTARLRMIKVPNFLLAALSLSILAVTFQMR